MSSKISLYDFLAGNAAIAALVGTRIYPFLAPTSKIGLRPYITYVRTGLDIDQHLLAPSGLLKESYQISIWADDTITLDTVATTVRQEIDGSRTATDTWGVDVRRVIVRNMIDSMEQPQDGSELPVFLTALDCDIIYLED